jgi:hypothetical protein
MAYLSHEVSKSFTGSIAAGRQQFASAQHRATVFAYQPVRNIMTDEWVRTTARRSHQNPSQPPQFGSACALAVEAHCFGRLDFAVPILDHPRSQTLGLPESSESMDGQAERKPRQLIPEFVDGLVALAGVTASARCN